MLQGQCDGIILTSPKRDKLGFALKFDFKASNNEIEYEALMTGIKMALDAEARNLTGYSDPQLVTSQMEGTYNINKDKMKEHLREITELKNRLKGFQLHQIPHTENTKVDYLAWLTNSLADCNTHNIIVRILTKVSDGSFQGWGDVFHHLFGSKPHHLANVTPAKIQACDLHHGSYGTDGAVIQWKYTLDGKEQTAKQLLHDIDDTKKQLSFKMLEGDLLELYKNMDITIHVETKGGVDFITWTISYELINLDNPHPLSLLNFFIEFTKEIEAHIFG
ncbi:UNVERIFIED_CONTAM: Kirola [Sesamum latifolium]|uniref:Kirola n=1 Tax=Sesamum latifolium TaxID=2727402 RepID=A0AAW2VCA4_9LAMI